MGLGNREQNLGSIRGYGKMGPQGPGRSLSKTFLFSRLIVSDPTIKLVLLVPLEALLHRFYRIHRVTTMNSSPLWLSPYIVFSWLSPNFLLVIQLVKGC